MLIALVLLVMHLESTDVSQQVIAEHKDDCQLAKERSRQYATALTALLNRGTVTIGQTTEVRCRVKHKEQS